MPFVPSYIEVILQSLKYCSTGTHGSSRIHRGPDRHLRDPEAHIGAPRLADGDQDVQEALVTWPFLSGVFATFTLSSQYPA